MAKSKNRNKRSTSSGQPKRTQRIPSTTSGTTQGGTAPQPQGSGVPRSPSARAAVPHSATTAADTASNSRSAERRRVREQERRRQRIITIGAVVGVIALLAAIALIINILPAEAPVPEGAVERYQDIPAANTEQGYARLGDAQASSVRVVEYASFACPACLTFHEDGYDAVLERVRAGDITYSFVPMGILGDGDINASRAAYCTGEQGQFWPYHDMLFSWQSLYGNQAFTLNRLRTGVENLGLNVEAYNNCMNSDLPTTLLESGRSAGQASPGFSGTPSFTINGVNLPWPFTEEQLNAAIDNAIANTGGIPGSSESSATQEPIVTDDVTLTDEATLTEETEEAEETAEVTVTDELEEAAETEEAEADQP